MSSSTAVMGGGSSAKVIGLISTGHFLSHFYLLLIPPLFPMLRDELGVGFTELGLSITVFSVVTGLTQAPTGFLVDRLGARKILVWGMMLEAAAFVVIGLVPTYWVLIAMMGVAGLANSVYHPADYAILNASVSHQRMGRAFSIHTAAGTLGGALAPMTMVALISVAGWKTGLIVCGVAGGLVGVLIALNSGSLRDPISEGTGAGVSGTRSGLRLLFSVPILLGLLFFVGISVAGTGVSAFGIATLVVIHDISVTDAATVLSAYLFASPVGVLCGGWVADRIRHHHYFAALCFALIALAFFCVAAIPMGLGFVAVLFLVGGFLSGAVSPSRDMLIRSLSPPNEMGKVFGFVSTGFNIGGMFAPLMFGYVLDNHDPSIVFWMVGAVSLASVLTVVSTGHQRTQPVAA